MYAEKITNTILGVFEMICDTAAVSGGRDHNIGNYTILHTSIHYTI